MGGYLRRKKVGERPTICMVVEPNPDRPFLLKYGLLKMVVLSLQSSLWWLQSSKISTCGILFNPHMLAAISMHDHAPMLVPLIHARSISPKSNKHMI
jgi:hypothetical protein